MEQEGPVALLLGVLETTGIACDELVLTPHKARLQVRVWGSSFRTYGLEFSVWGFRVCVAS